jgi:choice-of-anchor B domain-containing protein
MNRLSSTLLLISFLCTCVSAQSTFNTTLRDQLTYTDRLSDVWGYVAPDGTEYALVGLRNSLSIVSLADPDNIVEVANVPGDFSVWRDIKTYGDFAYVVADQGTSDEGILAIDLTNLPTSVSSVNYNTGNTSGADLLRAHNIYIDESTGLAYISGSNVNSGGMVIYDVATTPGVPTFEAFAPSVYAHDVFVQNGLMYASEINVGKLTIYDVSDLQSITALGSTLTPRTFTHNAWATADGNYVFTTDERGNASTAAYDVSDPTDIELMDEFRPTRSLNTNTIPHNVHVKDNFLVISHYTDGVEIVDATDPGNMVEVGYYDSWTGADGGGNGSWGAYPFLPSGLVLSSDINSGLYVFDVNYQLASRLAGTVTDAVTGALLNNVKITIADPAGTTSGTTATGKYKTGIATDGMTNVTYSLAGYESQTIVVNFARGIETVQDVALQAAVLPVILSSFTAEPSGKTAVKLNWTTASEAGSDHFQVERSLSGSSFEAVGRVAAAGESAVAEAYGFTDNGLTGGTYFYRLKQVDLDGSFAFSDVREVVLQSSEALRVYPNPVGNRLRLSDEVEGTVRIYRNDGALVRETKVVGRGLEVADLPAGQYWLRRGNSVVPFVKW